MDDQSDDPRELERKIEQAGRIASRLNDHTTVERLRAWIEDLSRSGGSVWRRDAQSRRSVHAPTNLGTERTSLRPRPGVLASSRVRD